MMANRSILETNRILDSVGEISSAFRFDGLDNPECMGHWNPESPDLGEFAFYRILGYRAPEEPESHLEILDGAGLSLIRALHVLHLPFVFAVSWIRQSVQLSFGVPEPVIDLIQGLLKGAIPEIRLTSGFLSHADLERLGTAGGVVTGVTGCGFALDDFLSGLSRLEEGTLMHVMVPVHSGTIRQSVDHFNGLIRQLNSLEKIPRTYGTMNRRTLEIPDPGIRQLGETLQKAVKRLDQSLDEGLWKVCTWCLAENPSVARRLASNYLSRFTRATTKEGYYEKQRYIPCQMTPFGIGRIFIPQSDSKTSRWFVDNPLHTESLDRILTFSEAIECVRLPRFEHPGFRVETTNKTSADQYDFDVNPPFADLSQSVHLGQLVQTGSDFSIELRDVMAHVGIFGITGSGKTTTTHRLLRRLHDQGIPFLVFEPVKKQYWRIVNEIPVQVYSAGEDALQLEFNPLQPSAGMTIGGHIERLLIAFASQSIFDSPLPEILRMLLEKVYEDVGFSAESRVIRNDPRRFPNLRDVLEASGAFVDQKTGYSDRVKQDVKGALQTRLSTLLSGEPRTVFDTRKPLDVDSLLNQPTIIELNELEDGAKNFAMTTLMCLIDETLRNTREHENLKRVIVLEEAHRFFTRQSNDGSSYRNTTGQYFTNLLSEIQSHGCGMVIVDQRPSRLDTNAIANTNIKIVHALADSQDIEILANGLKLNEYQKKRIRDFRRGEAIVGIIGKKEVCKIAIESGVRADKPLHACLFCPKTVCQKAPRSSIALQTLRKKAEETQVAQMDSARSVAWLVRHLSPLLTTNAIDGPCLAGQLIQTFDLSDREKRQIIRDYARSLEV